MIVSTDVGGTFIDFVVLSDGKLRAYKKIRSASVREDISEEVENVDEFHHGSTVGVNALIERKAQDVVLITTRGFGTMHRIGRQNRRNLYSLLPEREHLPISREIEVPERIGGDGEVLESLNEDYLMGKIEEIGDSPVAVVFLHSYRNPEHEIRAVEILRGAGKEVYASHEVCREIREYERTATTVVEAYVHRIVMDYLESLRGIGRDFYVMQSNGGKSKLENVRAISTLMSGPAGGVAAAEYFSRLLGVYNVITYDMGGTSADLGGIVDGEPTYTSMIEVGGIPIGVNSIDVLSIGAGGGSVAWIDDADRLRVGPKSAGSNPGPACYDRGGVEFTVTDSNLLLGILGSEISGVRLNAHRSWEAAKPLAESLGIGDEELVEGVRRIVDSNMSLALKKVSISRGYDPRDFVLFAYGGAGPMHATSIAREVGIRRIMVPPMPGAFSSLGVLLSPVRYDYTETVYLEYEDAVESVEKSLRKFERIAMERMREPRISVYLHMRYRGQGHELKIPYTPRAREEFERMHREIFGFTMDDEVMVINALYVATTHREIEIPRFEPGEQKVREIRTYRFREKIPIYTIDHFRECEGPCVIEESTSTILVEEGWNARIGNYGEVWMEWSG